MFVDDMTRLFNRADPAMPENKKVRHLMRGVNEQLLAGLARDPPRTVADFTKEAASMEQSLQQRGAPYGHQAAVAAAKCSTTYNTPTSLPAEEPRELIRSIVQEELEKPHFEAPQATVAAATEVVRDGIRWVVQPVPVTQPEPYVTYSEALRNPPAVPLAFSTVTAAPPQRHPVAAVPVVPQEPTPAMSKARL